MAFWTADDSFHFTLINFGNTASISDPCGLQEVHQENKLIEEDMPSLLVRNVKVYLAGKSFNGETLNKAKMIISTYASPMLESEAGEFELSENQWLIRDKAEPAGFRVVDDAEVKTGKFLNFD